MRSALTTMDTAQRGGAPEARLIYDFCGVPHKKFIFFTCGNQGILRAFSLQD
jgi:hypothetical protein